MLEASSVIEEELVALTSEDEFNHLFMRVQQSASDLELDELRLPRKRKVPRRYTGPDEGHFSSSITEYFRVKYYQFLDTTVQQMQERFGKNDLQVFSQLETALISGTVSEAAEAILRSYPEINVDFLKAELQIFSQTIWNFN